MKEVTKEQIIKYLQDSHKDLISLTDLNLEDTFASQDYDSLDLVEIVIMAEKEYTVCIKDDLINENLTPNKLVELILNELKFKKI